MQFLASLCKELPYLKSITRGESLGKVRILNCIRRDGKDNSFEFFIRRNASDPKYRKMVFFRGRENCQSEAKINICVVYLLKGRKSDRINSSGKPRAELEFLSRGMGRFDTSFLTKSAFATKIPKSIQTDFIFSDLFQQLKPIALMILNNEAKAHVLFVSVTRF